MITNIDKYKEWVKALCLLSFAGSGGRILLYGFSILFPKTVEAFIKKWALGAVLNSVPDYYFVPLLAASVVSLFGVLKMWKMNVKGVFLYGIAQVILYALPLIFLGNQSFNALNTIATVLFISSYSWLFFNIKKEN